MRPLIPLLCFINFALAARIFLSPQTKSHQTVSTQLAGSRLAQHLGLEEFETYAGHYAYGEETFVGKGQRSSLLVSVDEHDIDHIVPSSLHPTFSIKNAAESFDSLLNTYIRRAQHVYTNIIDSASSNPASERTLDAFFLTIPSSPATEQLYNELSLLNQFLESTDPSTFAAIELRGLSLLRSSLGASSEAYQAAVKFTKAFVESALAQSERVRLALITHDTALASVEKRDPQQSPLPNPLPPQPIYTKCFTTAKACNKKTNSCSGHGQCVETNKAGSTCFVCSCQKTKIKGKTAFWVGEKCERKDVSGPFVLITGTVIALLLVGYGSISLLANVGGEELPSTLLGGVVNSRKD